jgi:hypothetical protein
VKAYTRRALVTGGLGDKVRGCTDAVDADGLGVSCQSQGSMTDQAGTQPGRHLGVGLGPGMGKQYRASVTA